MQATDAEPEEQRSAPRLGAAFANAALWGIGAGMASTTLIIYLFNTLGARGFAVSLILATPQFVGVARIGAIRFTRHGAGRKRFCIAAYLASGLTLCAAPALVLATGAMLGGAPSGWSVLAAIVAVWCGYHLLEYMGTVALWAWLKALVPADRLGTFIGRRGFYLETGRLLGMLASGLAAQHFETSAGTAGSAELKLFGYSALILCGALFLAAAAVALAFLAADHLKPGDASRAPVAVVAPGGQTLASPPDEAPPSQPRLSWRDALTALFDPRVSRLLAYGCWFSFFNGFTQTAQSLFPLRVLDLNLIYLHGLRSVMTLGQALVSPVLGRLADRHGARGMMFVSQFLVGAGLAGYLLANESRPWLIGVAWLAWVAYAGINVGVPDLLLKLSPQGQAGACVAGYFAMTGICYAASTLVGGLAYDMLQGQMMHVLRWDLDRYQYLFYLGIITRIMGCGWLLRIREPRPEPNADARRLK